MVSRSRSRLSAPGLVRRQLAAEPGTALLIAATVLLVSIVVSLWPRAVDTLLGEDARDQLDGLSAARRDPTGSTTWFPVDPQTGTVGSATGSVSEAVEGQDVFDEWRDWLEGTRTGAGPQVRQILTGSEVTLTRRRDDIDKGPRAEDVVAMTLAVRMDEQIGDRVTLVEGRAPKAGYDLSGLFDDDADFAALVAERPVEIMVSADTAERMQWRVGESRSLVGVIPFRFTLVGTFEAVDPSAGYWSHLESTLFPYIVEDGNYGTTVNGVAYADVSALGALVVPNGLRADYWFTTDTAAATQVDRDDLLKELRALLEAGDMTSELVGSLEATAERQASFTTILRVLAVGPVGVALGVLWLTAVLAVARRRTALRLAAARGGSGTAIRGAMAVEGLALGLPAAAAGALAAALLLPRPAGTGTWLLPLLVGLAPAVAMAVAAGAGMRSGDTRRADARRADRARADAITGGARGGLAAALRRGAAPAARRSWRLGLEGLVVALAVVAVVTLRQRGLAPADDARPDPLLVALPVLLAAAGGVLALRLHPLPMRALARTLHGRRRLPHFLGAAQATRSAHAGLLAVVALVLGVAVSVLSVVTLSTVRAGLDHTAATAVGADLRVEGEGLTAEGAAAVAALDGVADVAVVRNAGEFPLEVGRNDSRVDVLTVDGAAVAAVQGPLGLDPLPALDDAGAPASGGPRAVLGGGDEDDLDRDVTLFVGEDHEPFPLHPVAGRRSVPGVTTGVAWVLVDDAAWRAATGDDPTVVRILVRVAGEDPAAVAAAITETLGEDARVTSRAGVRAAVGDTALADGVTVGLIAATALAGLLSAVVVLLALAVRAPERGRLAALLTTVGAPRGTAWRLVAWEVWPLLATGVVGGGIVGGLLPGLVLGAADLTAFTAGNAQPPVVVDGTALGALVAAAAAVVAMAALVATVRARGKRAVVVLREEE